MDPILPPLSNVKARIILDAEVLAHGWFAVGWARVMSMSYVVMWLARVVREIAAPWWPGIAYAAVKWFVWFFIYDTIVVFIDDELADEMFVFMDDTITGIVMWIHSTQMEQECGVVVGIAVVAAAAWITSPHWSICT